MPKLNGARSRRSKSRKRQFGETKPNYNLEVKKEWEDFLKKEGPRIKKQDPEYYYHLITTQYNLLLFHLTHQLSQLYQ